MKHCDHCGEPNANGYSTDIKKDNCYAGAFIGNLPHADLCDKCAKKLYAIIHKFVTAALRQPVQS